jgi:membrane protease YdiL (CAAX protease family)
MMSLGAVPAIVFSAFYFAIVHESGTYIPAFLAGIVLAVQALNYRALWGPIIAHATYNAAASIDWDCFHIVWNPPIGDPTLLKLTWTSIPVIVAGSTITAFIVSRKNAGACATTRQS